MNKYITVISTYGVTIVEITETRQAEIDNLYEGDLAAYVEEAVSDELGLRIGDMQWVLSHGDAFSCIGKTPEISNK